MNTAIIPIESAIVLRGQRAWGRIKSTAAEQRQLWREVGAALLVGRRENKADKAFGAWCTAYGFGDMDRGDRADAMWLAQNWAGVEPFHTNLTHPARIRQAHRDLQAPQPAQEDTAFDVLLANAAKVTGKERGIIAKVAHAREATPEGRTAARLLEKQADALGMSKDDMVHTATRLDVLNQVPPQRRDELAGVIEGLQQFFDITAAALAHSPELTAELVATKLYAYLKSKGL